MNHQIEFRGDRVVKRYASQSDDRAEREWAALTLLEESASGLAPRPLESHLDDAPSWVVMARVPGVPLRGGTVAADQEQALAAAAAVLFDAVPAGVLAALPERAWVRDSEVAGVRAWCEAPLPAGTATVILRAQAGARAWLAATPTFEATRPVFSNGDGNLANYLWDRSRVRVIDFEYAGRSELAQELAEITEHVAAWVDTAFDAERFLRRFALSAPERRALIVERRFRAVDWLAGLSLQDPELALNPTGTAERQAERVLALLAAG